MFKLYYCMCSLCRRGQTPARLRPDSSQTPARLRPDSSQTPARLQPDPSQTPARLQPDSSNPLTPRSPISLTGNCRPQNPERPIPALSSRDVSLGLGLFQTAQIKCDSNRIITDVSQSGGSGYSSHFKVSLVSPATRYPTATSNPE